MCNSLCLISRDDIWREALAGRLRSEGFAKVQAYRNIADVAVEDLSGAALVVLDCQGFDEQSEAISALKKVSSSVRIAVLAQDVDTEVLLKSLRLGAEGYVLKTKDPSHMIAALRQVASGERHFPSESAKRLGRGATA